MDQKTELEAAKNLARKMTKSPTVLDEPAEAARAAELNGTIWRSIQQSRDEILNSGETDGDGNPYFSSYTGANPRKGETAKSTKDPSKPSLRKSGEEHGSGKVTYVPAY